MHAINKWIISAVVAHSLDVTQEDVRKCTVVPAEAANLKTIAQELRALHSNLPRNKRKKTHDIIHRMAAIDIDQSHDRKNFTF